MRLARAGLFGTLAFIAALVPVAAAGGQAKKAAPGRIEGWEPSRAVADILYAKAACVATDVCDPCRACATLDENLNRLLALQSVQADRDCVALLQFYIGEHQKEELLAELRRRKRRTRALLESLRVYVAGECSPLPSEDSKAPFLPKDQVLQDINALLQQ